MYLGQFWQRAKDYFDRFPKGVGEAKENIKGFHQFVVFGKNPSPPDFHGDSLGHFGLGSGY